MKQTRAFLVMVAAFAVCVGVVAYQGPGMSWIRGSVGDIAVVVLLVAGLAAFNLGTPRQRVLGVGVLALGVELLQGLQLVGPDAPLIVHLIFGSTFDPIDLAMYGVGLGLAVLAERSWAD
ncbi:MAG: DUF2809 domain-containing protein [Myxococcota bacterium]